MNPTTSVPAAAQCWSAVFTGVLLLLSAAVTAAGMPETIERVKPSVVAVGSYQKTRSPSFLYRGTGFVVGDGTIVATNAHVVPEALNAENRESLMILAVGVGAEPQPRDARLLALDKMHDLALLRINGTPLPALALDESGDVREGQTFAFTGFPVGNVLGFAPVTHRGMVSSLTPVALPTPTARQLDQKVIRSLRTGSFNVLQLDATAYPGNSGSPLYDIDTGRVVGILNMVFVRSTRESALSQPSGISFAVPIRFLVELLTHPQ